MRKGCSCVLNPSFLPSGSENRCTELMERTLGRLRGESGVDGSGILPVWEKLLTPTTPNTTNIWWEAQLLKWLGGLGAKVGYVSKVCFVTRVSVSLIDQIQRGLTERCDQKVDGIWHTSNNCVSLCIFQIG